MLVAALFRRLGVPCDLCQRHAHFVAVQVEEGHFPRRDPGHLQVADIVDLPGVFQDRRNVGGKVGFLLVHSDDQRRILPCGKDLVRIILKHQSQCIAPANTDHAPGDRVHRTDLVFLVVVVHQLHGHFRVRIAVEGIPVPQQLFLQLGIILDDAIVDTRDIRFHRAAARSGAVAADMRMGIDDAGISVGRPACMSDPAAPGQRASLVRLVGQVIQLSGGFHHLCQRRSVPHGQPGRVISPVFQPAQAVQKDRRCLPVPCISNDSAHIMILPILHQ